MRLWIGCILLCIAAATSLGGEVLIVADEFPAMHFLAEKLKSEEGRAVRVLSQEEMPDGLSGYEAVIVYIHRQLREGPEQQFIRYARGGGRLVVLHHSISSGKRANRDWFGFLGVTLPTGEVLEGGYQWYEPVTLQIVDRARDHFITRHKVQWTESIRLDPAPGEVRAALPGFTLDDSEVYLNHRLDGERTILLGFRYADAKSGRVWQQDTAGWVRPAGAGWIVYFLPGHNLKDFEVAPYCRMVLNAVIWRPEAAKP